MKEQNKTPEKELNKMETKNLLHAEFKTLVIRLLSEVRWRIDDLNENLKQKDRTHKKKTKKDRVRNEEYTK